MPSQRVGVCVEVVGEAFDDLCDRPCSSSPANREAEIFVRPSVSACTFRGADSYRAQLAALAELCGVGILDLCNGFGGVFMPRSVEPVVQAVQAAHLPAGASGSHTLRLQHATLVTAKSFYVCAIEGRDTSDGVPVSNYGYTSQTLAGLISCSDETNELCGLPLAIDVAQPDLLVIVLGINDWQAGTAAATNKTTIATIIDPRHRKPRYRPRSSGRLPQQQHPDRRCRLARTSPALSRRGCGAFSRLGAGGRQC